MITFDEIQKFFSNVDVWPYDEDGEESPMRLLKDNILIDFRNCVARASTRPILSDRLERIINALDFVAGGVEKDYSALCQFFNVPERCLQGRLLIELIEDWLHNRRDGEENNAERDTTA